VSAVLCHADEAVEDFSLGGWFVVIQDVWNDEESWWGGRGAEGRSSRNQVLQELMENDGSWVMEVAVGGAVCRKLSAPRASWSWSGHGVRHTGTGVDGDQVSAVSRCRRGGCRGLR
jgi:hypothetical protein